MDKSTTADDRKDYGSSDSVGRLSGEDDENAAASMQELRDLIPILLQRVLELKRERACSPTLSSPFPYQSNGKDLTAYYVSLGVGEKVYLAIDDPDSDFADPGESRLEGVSREGFIKWATEEDMRTLDVYRHLRDYINQESRPPVEVPVDYF